MKEFGMIYPNRLVIIFEEWDYSWYILSSLWWSSSSKFLQQVPICNRNIFIDHIEIRLNYEVIWIFKVLVWVTRSNNAIEEVHIKGGLS